MKKLRLELDHLRVETFSPLEDANRGRGTVEGRIVKTYDGMACPFTAPDYDSTCLPGVYTCPECASPPETAYSCGDPET